LFVLPDTNAGGERWLATRIAFAIEKKRGAVLPEDY
jgi:hypothetical protein